MIRKAWRTIIEFLRSPGLATWLLAIVGVWSALATIVPQGGATDPQVVAWASTHSLVEPVVRAVGLHQAFTSVLFRVCALALGLSTALCAWRRTKVALGKGRALRGAAVADERSLAEGHRLEIACDPVLGASEVLSVASETLGHLGIRTKRQGDSITAVSPVWSVWGSPVFHWALLALIVTMLLGSLLRSSGLMGVAVGQAKIDGPESYGVLSTGPLHGWLRVQRTIRVDAFDPNFKTGGVDRGPTPTVSVLDARGQVIKSQRVYPNETLKTGSLTVYPADYGLAAIVSLADASGAESGRSVQLMDFSTEATGGTAPLGYLTVDDEAGSATLKLLVSVPLDRAEDGFVERLPAEPKARVLVTSMDDEPVLDRVLRPGEGLKLPGTGTLRLVDVRYYARLQLVDDPSIPFLYAGLTVAMIGLGIATLTQQQIVSATLIETPDGAKLAIRMRLWRNVTSSRGEIESELVKALGGVEKGDMT